MEYLIYCDESDKGGSVYSNFYGGALVRSIHYEEVVTSIKQYRLENQLKGEMKWTKVTHQYLEKYKGLMDVFFTFVEQDKIKVRVMFQQNQISQPVLKKYSKEEREDSYFKLYYQFFKHAFGFKYANPDRTNPIYLRAFFGQFPDKKEKVEKFKEFIYHLQFTQEFSDAHINIRYNDIVEAVSHKHDILQCADIITGAMWFRLNKMHLLKPEGSRVRGKRTRAKEELYQHINKRIREIRPNFNIGINTKSSDSADKWNDSYRHWLFIPKGF